MTFNPKAALLDFFSLITVVLAVFPLILGCSAQTSPKPAEAREKVPRALTAAEKRELNTVFPLKTRRYMLNSKSIFITDARSKRTIELSHPETKKEVLDSLFFDVALGRRVEDPCRTPEYIIATESNTSAEVLFTVSYDCNDVTGGGLDTYLIQGRLDGKNSRSKPILERLFVVTGS